MGELQLCFAPKIGLPVVNLLTNLPLGLVALFAEAFQEDGGGIGVVIQRFSLRRD